MSYEGSLSVKEIAKFIGKSEVFVRKSIENGSLPIGSFNREGKKASYYISPKRAAEWIGYIRTDEKIDNDDSVELFVGGESHGCVSCGSPQGMGNSLL